MRNKRSETHN